MGGTLEGDPIHTGDNVGSDSSGTNLILLKPSDIYKIGDMGIEVSLSRDATIEQATDPTGRQPMARLPQEHRLDVPDRIHRVQGGACDQLRQASGQCRAVRRAMATTAR
jgi:hypothetical protein